MIRKKPAQRMHAIVEKLAHAYKGHLPHEMASGEFTSRNVQLSAATRTRLAFIEDCISDADETLDDLLSSEALLLDALKGMENYCRHWLADHGDGSAAAKRCQAVLDVIAKAGG